MFNIFDLLENLHRPKILVRAARLGLSDYNRETDLQRISQTAKTSSPAAVIDRLLSQEETLELARRNGDASYSIHRHIRVLTAVLAEARLALKRTQKVA
ncbi:MAG: DNA repair protein RadA [Rhodobacteraceae bacterium]|nr:DNA repair protein RadA [Paracoccaceae bacterium]